MRSWVRTKGTSRRGASLGAAGPGGVDGAAQAQAQVEAARSAAARRAARGQGRGRPAGIVRGATMAQAPRLGKAALGGDLRAFLEQRLSEVADFMRNRPG